MWNKTRVKMLELLYSNAHLALGIVIVSLVTFFTGASIIAPIFGYTLSIGILRVLERQNKVL